VVLAVVAEKQDLGGALTLRSDFPPVMNREAVQGRNHDRQHDSMRSVDERHSAYSSVLS
jgi:hypothetical protein